MPHFFAVSTFINEHDTHDQPPSLPPIPGSAILRGDEGVPLSLRRALLSLGPGLRAVAAGAVALAVGAAAGAAPASRLSAWLVCTTRCGLLRERLLVFDADAVMGCDRRDFSLGLDLAFIVAVAAAAATAVEAAAVPPDGGLVALLLLSSGTLSLRTLRVAPCRPTLKSCRNSRSSSAPTRWATTLSFESLGLYVRLIVRTIISLWRQATASEVAIFCPVSAVLVTVGGFEFFGVPFVEFGCFQFEPCPRYARFSSTLSKCSIYLKQERQTGRKGRLHPKIYRSGIPWTRKLTQKKKLQEHLPRKIAKRLTISRIHRQEHRHRHSYLLQTYLSPSRAKQAPQHCRASRKKLPASGP